VSAGALSGSSKVKPLFTTSHGNLDGVAIFSRQGAKIGQNFQNYSIKLSRWSRYEFVFQSVA
ncbi:MAG: hypothetical protein ABR542_07820, partial [Desulfonatronovibrio sp.]